MVGNREKGAVAPLVAIMLVLIVVIVALVVDLGHVHYVKIQLQKAVDAAALAAAQQLDGSPDAAQKAIGVALAAAANNSVDGEPLRLTQEDVRVGNWDQENLGLSAGFRFLIGGPRPDAVLVTASREVDHVFFYFSENTKVSVDAIAANIFEELMVPLAVVSCIPSTGPRSGEPNICDIRTYAFASENGHSAAWTSLTLGGEGEPSEEEVMEFLKPGGADMFKRIIEGLDKTPVVQGPLPYSPFHEGCEGNAGESISCGLGGEFRRYKVRVGDPILRYTELPRYINDDSEEREAFLDILYQDGILDPRKWSNPSDYSQFLGFLYNNSLGDFFLRFQPRGGEDNFIEYHKKTDTYTPNFNRILDYAGYPSLNVTTDSMPKVMDTVLNSLVHVSRGSKEKGVSFRSNMTDHHPPFDVYGRDVSHGYGTTLMLTVPVVFAGACEDFDDGGGSFFDSREESQMHYVGMARLLVTRAWQGNVTYDCKEPVQVWGSFPVGCDAGDFNPQLVNSSLFSGPVPGPENPSSEAFEGLLRAPAPEDERRAGVHKIVLVE